MNCRISIAALAIAVGIALGSCGGGSSGGGGGGGDTTSTTTAATYAVGGTVVGLNGSGFALQNNAVDDLAITADGTFTFATKITGDYAVTVKTQPTVPVQTCTVSNGGGTATADVTGVAVTCLTDYSDTSYWQEPFLFDRTIVSAGGGKKLRLNAQIKKATAVFNVAANLNRSSTAAAGGFQGDFTVTELSESVAQDTRARFSGGFFNTGSTAAGNRTNDVFAEVSLNATSARFLAGKCTNSGCTTSTTLTKNGSGASAAGFVVLGAATMGTEYTLTLNWDGATSFTVGYKDTASGTPLNSITVDLSNASDPNVSTTVAFGSAVPGLAVKQFGVRNAAAGVGESATITALVDNVKTCEGGPCTLALHDDFETASGILDRTKWVDAAFSSQIVDGKLVLATSQEYQAGGGAFGTWSASNNVSLGVQSIASATTPKAISADVTYSGVVTDNGGTSHPVTNVSTQLFYTGAGTNNVFVEISIFADGGPPGGTTTYTKFGDMFICPKAGGSCTHSVAGFAFTGGVAADTSYAMKLVDKGSGKFTATIGSETVTFDLAQNPSDSALLTELNNATFFGGRVNMFISSTNETGDSAKITATLGNLRVGVP